MKVHTCIHRKHEMYPARMVPTQTFSDHLKMKAGTQFLFMQKNKTDENHFAYVVKHVVNF